MAFFYYICTEFFSEMRQTLNFFAVVLLVLCACSPGGQGQDASGQKPVDTVPMLIMQIQKCARLYTAEYHVHKIVTHDDVISLKGSVLQQAFDIKLPLGDRKVAIPMDATLKAYIDFESFSERNIERNGRRITILLPDPKVVMTSSKIDQKNIKQYVGLVRSGFTDAEMTNYEQQGRASILQNIPRMGIIDTAKENAARVLVPMLVQMGYQEQDITVAFRKDYMDGGIKALLDNTIIEK